MDTRLCSKNHPPRTEINAGLLGGNKLILNKMELLNKVKDELEKKGYDFSSEFWTDEMLSVLYDAVYTTEKILSGQEQTKKLEPKKTPTTYRECLEALPDGYRELALKNAEEQKWYQARNGDFDCTYIPEAIDVCFWWVATSEERVFWQAVSDHYLNNTPLPELPTNP